MKGEPRFSLSPGWHEAPKPASSPIKTVSEKASQGVWGPLPPHWSDGTGDPVEWALAPPISGKENTIQTMMPVESGNEVHLSQPGGHG